ncbi:MAG: efflux RND transporter permease subunit [Acidobacteriota bacterium]
MNLPKLAVTRPITTVMILVSVMVIGGIALVRLPLAYLPEIDVPYIGIRIPYPNSNPTQVEKEVAKPVEEVLATLAGVKTMRSESSADQATFDLEFNWGHNLDVVRMQVSEKMDQIRPTLPDGVGEITIFSFNTSDIPVVQGRISAKGVDLSENYDLIESRILNRIRRVPGVARVDLDGVAPKEIDIALILAKIKEHNVDVGRLIQRLQGTSSNMVLGQVDQAGLRYTARVVGSFDSVADIGDFPVDERGLRLKDIAEIDYEEPPIPWGRHLDREKAIALEVFKESTANTVDVVHAVHKVIKEDISGDPLLQGVELFVWEDQAEEITGGINGLLKAGAIGAFLAIFSLYFFLRRLDSTVIVAMSIPFSVIAACGVMYFMGMTLNILSMMGLMVGVGMLVDNAIVVLESIDRRHRTEKDTRIAALDGSRQIVLAVVASTATTLIVFLPLVVGANSGLTTWLREVGVTMSLALACSLFSSLTLIPLVSAHFLRARTSEPSRMIARLEDVYAATLGWTLRHKAITGIAVIVVIGVGLSPLFTGMVEQAMFSAQVNERLYLEYDFDDFHYKSEAERAVNVVEEYLYAHRDEFLMKSVYSFYQENYAGTTIVLTRKDLDGDQISDLRAKIREGLPEMPGVRCYFHEDADSGGSDTFFAVKFFGQDSGVLQELGEEMERRLETVEGVRDISASHQRGRKEIQVSVNRDKAARLGMTAKDVSDIFGFTLGGMRLNRFSTGEREVETWIALRLEDRSDLDDLKKIQFGTGDGRVITLGDIADFQVITRQQEIVRENRKVRSSVWATYEGEDWNEVRTEIEGLASSLVMPAGYSWSWNDRILEQDQQGAQMGINFLLALALVYLVMASLFESLAQPFAILLCSVIFALSGAAWMLVITDTPFNLMSWIGMLILIGIVVNNGIVLLDRMNQLRKEGIGREEAIIAAGRDRMRPILMTAATTVIGLVPLAIGGSTISGLFYYPLARTVIGGLVVSAFLTLVALPNVTLGVEAIAAWFRRIWSLSRPRRAAAAGSGGGELVPTHPAP